MQVYKIYPVGFASNSYLITADGKTAVCIDPAQPRISDEAKKRGLTVTFVLLTHGHFDHIGGVASLQKAGAKVGCLFGEEKLALYDNLAAAFGEEEIESFKIDFTFKDGEELELAGLKIKVISTAGHTAGGACYLIDNNLFTGDTLFEGSVGRCDLPTGNGLALEKSVKKLYALDGDYTVYAGHGEDTTLDYERKYNGAIRA
ncbi:MAG: MBL fold metallo-hydrolase [Clostridia bacterium]|nr:MBL fold metallo-hydrolase [Clostridia bacterium]